MLKNLTAGGLLARNTIWNIVGEGAPLLIAVIAIPVLVRGLGTDRFGILMIVWLLIGYLSLFDLGVGRALTNLVAQKLGKGEEASLPPLIWTANILDARGWHRRGPPSGRPSSALACLLGAEDS